MLTSFWVVPGSPFFPNFTGIYQRVGKEEVEEEGSEQGIRATVINLRVQRTDVFGIISYFDTMEILYYAIFDYVMNDVTS